MREVEISHYIQCAVSSVRVSQQWQNEQRGVDSDCLSMPLQRCMSTDLLRPVLPYSQVLLSFELCKLRVAMLSARSAGSRPEAGLKHSELAHSPLLLSKRALPQAYDFAVHRERAVGDLPNHAPKPTPNPTPTYLLIYSTGEGSTSFIELEPPVYTLALVLRRASDEQCALRATEVLIELSEYWDGVNVVEFVEQGLKLISHLNELGLIH